MKTDKVHPKTLEENIMGSADCSTSYQTRVCCTQADLENSLEPIMRALLRLRRSAEAKKARETLARFLAADRVIEERVFKRSVSPAAEKLHSIASAAPPRNTQCTEVYTYLKERLEPIVALLRKATSPRAKRLASRLEKTYERRSSAPPMTREQRLLFGFIPWKKMTPAERERCRESSRSDTYGENSDSREYGNEWY